MWWKSRIPLVVEDSPIEQPAVSVSSTALEEEGRRGRSVVWVQNHGIKRPFLLQINDSLRKNVIRMSGISILPGVKPGLLKHLLICYLA